MAIHNLRNVKMPLDVVLGSSQITVEALSAMGEGTIIELDRLAGEPVDIVVADRLVAKGEVVIVDETFGVRVTEVVTEKGKKDGRR
jgi:flagellar motor switch protein FliN/FliY